MMSSRDPGELGMYGFRNRKGYSYDGYAIANATTLQHERAWEVLARAGKRVILLGVPQTHPPKPINGHVVSDFLTPSTKGQYTPPPELKDEVECVSGGYVLGVENFRTPDKEALVRRESMEKIAAITDPTAVTWARVAYRPQELYRALNGVPPDLIVYFGDLHWRSVGSVGLRSLYTFDNGTGPDEANHNRHGIFIMNEAGCRQGRVEPGYHQGLRGYDVAPTVLNLFGLSADPRAVGRSLTSIG
jgi:predicted AlkP superfamily phosphohydrolase/phosphomutase